MQTASGAFKTMVEGNELIVRQAMQMTLPLIRTNYCDTPSFGSGSTGKWRYTQPGTVTTSATHALAAAKSMLITFVTGAAFNNVVYIPVPELLPGHTYKLSLQIWLDSGSPPIDIQGANGVGVSGSNGSISTTGSWQPLHCDALISVTGGYVVLWNTAAVTAGANVRAWVDAILFEESTTVNSFFDGNSVNGRWLGVPGLSPSTLNVAPYQDVSVSIESSVVDRQLTTSLPDGTILITGYPTASATVILSGQVDPTDDTKTIAWLLNPYEPTSPMYRHVVDGSPVVFQEGLFDGVGGTAGELITVFTGYVDDSMVDMVAGTVTLTCLDNRTTLRSVPVLPMVAATMDVARNNSGVTGVSTYSPGLTSSWVLRALLAANNYYDLPGPRSACRLYAPCAGSAYPTIFSRSGYMATAGSAFNDASNNPPGPMTFVPGQWTQEACASAEVQASFAGGTIDMSPGNGGFITEWYMNADPNYVNLPNPISGNLGYVAYADMTDGVGNVYVNAGTTYSALVEVLYNPALPGWVAGGGWSNQFMPTGGTPFSLTSGWHKFTASIVPLTSTTVKFSLWVDDVSVMSYTTTLTGGVTAPTDFFAERGTIISQMNCESIQISAETAGLPSIDFVPNASIDPSLNNLISTVDISGQDPWSVIQALAEAEQGIAGFDEHGFFRSVNRRTLAQGATQRNITSASSLKTYQIETGLSLVTNHVTANVNAIVRSSWQTIWGGIGTNVTSNGYYYINPGATDVVFATLNSACIVGTLTGVIPSGGVNATHPLSGYRADRNTAGTGGEINNLIMLVEQLTPTTVKITITNPNSYIAYFSTPTGYPTPGVASGIVLAGETLLNSNSTSPNSTANVVSVSTVADSQWPPASEGGANPLVGAAIQLADNPWRQNLASVQALTDDLLTDLYKPRPVLRNVAIVADPRLQLGDRVTILDPDASKIADDVYLIGINTTASATAWDQVITARAISTPGGWIMGQVGRSEMGVATYV